MNSGIKNNLSYYYFNFFFFIIKIKIFKKSLLKIKAQSLKILKLYKILLGHKIYFIQNHIRTITICTSRTNKTILHTIVTLSLRIIIILSLIALLPLYYTVKHNY